MARPAIQARMVALQEELDWLCYRLYGLTRAPTIAGLVRHLPEPRAQAGERPFEIVMARQMAAGELQTSWFERHGSTPITEIPEHWPERYRKLVARRIELIRVELRTSRLIERPEYKRRWNREPWDDQVKRALRTWLLDRLEIRPLLARRDAAPPELTVARPGRARPARPRLPPGGRPLRRPARLRRARSWSRSWSHPSRCRSCPYCATSPRA